ncbi:dihydrofolate reductase family protein [Myroides sp. WP-1]|uniref:dihydrofolate reductase family protein n=1 Tax=Myroides sp. WP-1 TaxID=2759944 RepID=UPI0015FC5DC3|nr:dihydrofolate reductase family protein [Myroides sp. WP-1]MBB1137896.1 dihydrofolate reductase [Myroides sp. WP-1]
MRNVILYIAVSLDGYIADGEGSVSFLDDFQDEKVGDYGYQDFLAEIDTCLMGSKTYKTILDFGYPWPYPEQETYVITSNPQLKIDSPNTVRVTDNIGEVIQQLKEKKSDKNIWLVGGGQLVHYVLNANLLDQMVLSITPKILGEGIRLFPEKSIGSTWELTHQKAFETGMMVLTYTKRKDGR